MDPTLQLEILAMLGIFGWLIDLAVFGIFLLLLIGIYVRLGQIRNILRPVSNLQATPRQPQTRAAAAHAAPPNIPPPNFHSL